ncbi:hypothetical protein OIU77_020646 [Salix suchowensis]|uniref:Uncharacterized protein n=1 Tax=Salix suchowensis TaxID=1278906 RepID=A0ABQ9C777_9ROSI|nr:hypothetical protein OIU77_020646 [Salix suchowensis]
MTLTASYVSQSSFPLPSSSYKVGPTRKSRGRSSPELKGSTSFSPQANRSGVRPEPDSETTFDLLLRTQCL